MIEKFKKYVNNYDMNNENIKLKYDHSFRVMELSEKYAKKLGWNDDDIELAKVIGLLHDIGRFEQLRVYNSYLDQKTIDHADYSIVQLFDEGLIEKFTDKKEEYEIIKMAIKYHNKKDLPKIEDERTLKFCKLIRDVDKIDIIYLLNPKVTDEEISEEIIDAVNNHKLANWTDSKTKNDNLVIYLCYVFDINYDECLDEILINLRNFYNKIDDKDNKIKDIYEKVEKYLIERIDKNVRK